MAMEKFVVYMNAHKEVNAYHITNIAENDVYLIGYCHAYGRVLTLRHDRIIQEFDNIEDAKQYALNVPDDKFHLYDSLINSQKRELKKNPPCLSVTFCFSGFKAAAKEEMIQLAIDHKLRVVSDVSSKTDFLVICEKSKTVGPSKLAKAEKHGVKVIYEDAFFYMLETGEMPCDNVCR